MCVNTCRWLRSSGLPSPSFRPHLLGAAFTRFQTLRLQRIFPEVLAEQLISYGSCQFPTLGFVVERFKAIQAFVPEIFHKIKGKAGKVYGTNLRAWEERGAQMALMTCVRFPVPAPLRPTPLGCSDSTQFPEGPTLPKQRFLFLFGLSLPYTFFSLSHRVASLSHGLPVCPRYSNSRPQRWGCRIQLEKASPLQPHSLSCPLSAVHGGKSYLEF